MSVTIHVLRAGTTPCGMTGSPATWPANHSWLPEHVFIGSSEQWEKINPNTARCAKCVAALEREKKK